MKSGELDKGKYIAEYDRRTTFPVGVHVYHEGTICEVICSISGYKAPAVKNYWQERMDVNLDAAGVNRYSQFGTCYLNDLVTYNDTVYICITENGYKFGEILSCKLQRLEKEKATQIGGLSNFALPLGLEPRTL